VSVASVLPTLAAPCACEASLWLVPSTPVARVFLWISATEGRPELPGLVITASFQVSREPGRVLPSRWCLPDSGGRVVIVPGIRVRLCAAGGALSPPDDDVSGVAV
jgi:hypothetical protein